MLRLDACGVGYVFRLMSSHWRLIALPHDRLPSWADSPHQRASLQSTAQHLSVFAKICRHVAE
jgi:hypothetical protein